ncbi:MAG: hypothetical protein PHR53_01500 [Bacteroidales bacterium]|nr:hypothetical protein [Bacteroidales bacterium]
MKRFFVFIALFLGISAFVSAQPRAIGGRLGYNLEASYQHSLGNNFIELDAGLIGFGSGIQATGIYDFVIMSPNWTSKGEWNFYAGPGLTLGYRWHDKDFYTRWTSAAIFGVSGQVGLDYTFPFNLQLAVDYRPLFGVAVGDNAGNWNDNKRKYNNARFYSEGFYDFAVSVRYRF